MANDLEKFNHWVAANGDNALGAITGAVELFRMLRPSASAKNVSLDALLIGDPITDRAIADAVGVAAIAGRNGVSVDDILTAANLLKGLAVFVTAII